MRCRLDFYHEGKGAAPDRRKQFFAGLDRTLGPAMLLRLEAVHVHRELGWRNYVRKEDEFPARELRAVAEIKILSQSVVLPTARLLNAGGSPETGSPVEIKEPSAPAAGRLFKQEVPVQKHRLNAGKK